MKLVSLGRLTASIAYMKYATLLGAIGRRAAASGIDATGQG